VLLLLCRCRRAARCAAVVVSLPPPVVLLLSLPLVLLLLCRCGGSKRERDECERSLLTSLGPSQMKFQDLLSEDDLSKSIIFYLK
jgi:hypothetical protein